MEIGLFQLENLFLSRTQFQFLDLRGAKHAPPELPQVVWELLSKATPVTAPEVENYLAAKAVAKAYPIVLICENGKASGQLARRLEGAGYGNVYVVTRGVDGLVSEL